jgi:hypothetical protein
VEYANGKPLNEILGVSYKDANGVIQHNPDRPRLPISTRLPDVRGRLQARPRSATKYNVPFLLHPFVALYSTRGCPAQCTFCLWPQTLSGHPWRKRSTDAVAAEMAKAKNTGRMGEGILLRRRHLQHPEGAHRGAVREAEAAGADLVVHIARDHRLRNAEGDEGSRLPAADRGLRVGRRSRS